MAQDSSYVLADPALAEQLAGGPICEQNLPVDINEKHGL